MSTSKGKLNHIADQITIIDQLVKSGAKLGWCEEQPDEAHTVIYGSRSQARYWKHKGTKIIRALIIPIRKK